MYILFVYCHRLARLCGAPLGTFPGPHTQCPATSRCGGVSVCFLCGSLCGLLLAALCGPLVRFCAALCVGRPAASCWPLSVPLSCDVHSLSPPLLRCSRTKCSTSSTLSSYNGYALTPLPRYFVPSWWYLFPPMCPRVDSDDVHTGERARGCGTGARLLCRAHDNAANATTMPRTREGYGEERDY